MTKMMDKAFNYFNHMYENIIGLAVNLLYELKNLYTRSNSLETSEKLTLLHQKPLRRKLTFFVSTQYPHFVFL